MRHADLVTWREWRGASRIPPGRRAAGRVGIVLGLCLAAGCATVRERRPVPEELAERAVIPGIPRARFFGDTVPPWLDESLRELERRRIEDPDREVPERSGCYLAISGGGANGAYGAGLLKGWTESGTRPLFDMVTGISTGALTAPFAFLGPEYDQQLEEVYTTIRTEDIVELRGTIEGLTGDAMADTGPLRQLIARYVNEEVRQAIAREHGKGRGLLVATTNLDAGRPVIWSLGRIAASDDPNALELIHSVLLASASIPGAFPPVYIDVEVDGERYDEMHVDGGAASQVFLYPASLDWRRVTEALEIRGEQHVYVIRNSLLQPQWKVVKPTLFPIVGRTIDTLIKTQGVGDLYRIYLGAQRDGLNYRLAYIPDGFEEVPAEAFDPVYMRKLFDFAREKAKNGYPWDEAPPGMTPP